MDEVQELKKEIQELRMLLEVEKQKSAKAQKELEMLEKKAGKAKPIMPGASRASSPKAISSGPQIEMGDSPVTTDELKRLQNLLNETQKKLDEIEQSKWEVQKKNIELKENLQRLKVQGSNHKKDIQATMEKVDRKENQNFKVRLELTDHRKEVATKKEDDEAQQKVLNKLDKQIEEIIAQNEKLKAQVKEEERKRDKINLEFNKARDLLAQYEDHFLSRLYLK